jgi:hypothetical protein
MHEDKQHGHQNGSHAPGSSAWEDLSCHQKVFLSRLRGGGEDSRSVAAKTDTGKQGASQGCLRMGGIPYREDGQFNVGAPVRRHPVLYQLDVEGLLVGHFMMPKALPGRTRMLAELGTSLGDESREDTPVSASAAPESPLEDSEDEASESDESRQSYEVDEVESPEQTGPSVPSTSKGASQIKRSNLGGSHQSDDKQTGRKKQEKFVKNTGLRQPSVFLAQHLSY